MSVEAELQINIVLVGDALVVLRTLPACCVDPASIDLPRIVDQEIPTLSEAIGCTDREVEAPVRLLAGLDR